MDNHYNVGKNVKTPTNISKCLNLKNFKFSNQKMILPVPLQMLDKKKGKMKSKIFFLRAVKINVSQRGKNKSCYYNYLFL